jgi:hypothetical protein
MVCDKVPIPTRRTTTTSAARTHTVRKPSLDRTVRCLNCLNLSGITLLTLAVQLSFVARQRKAISLALCSLTLPGTWKQGSDLPSVPVLNRLMLDVSGAKDGEVILRPYIVVRRVLGEGRIDGGEG